MTVADTISGAVSKAASVTEEVITTAHSLAPLAERAMKALALWPGLGSIAVAEAAVEWADARYGTVMSALEALIVTNAAGNLPTGATLSKAGTELDMHITPGMANSAVLGGPATTAKP